MAAAGEVIELLIERPVAGGRMLARHSGRVALVAGAIPGERVRARVARVAKRVLWADVLDVVEESADRRQPICDPACGGTLYAHIRYERQLQLKGQIVADAFHRLAKLPMQTAPLVRPSPEVGYRMRARVHVRDRRAGFFREGSHKLCDARPTGQLRPEALDAVDAILHAMADRADRCEAMVIAENAAGSERVVHLEPREGSRLDDVRLDRLPARVTGVTTAARARLVTLAGNRTVTDSAGELFGARPPISAAVSWTRHAASFFQANRFLVGDLLRRVLDENGGECLDLYAGVGLFAVALAASGRRVTAVEGDRWSGTDLDTNAVPFSDRLTVVHAAVEDFLSTRSWRPELVVADPPRTGISTEALEGLIAWRPPRVVYVSCDPPTLARDAGRLAAAGYGLSSIDAFDLFPNTPHVEVIASFWRPQSIP